MTIGSPLQSLLGWGNSQFQCIQEAQTSNKNNELQELFDLSCGKGKHVAITSRELHKSLLDRNLLFGILQDSSLPCSSTAKNSLEQEATHKLTSAYMVVAESGAQNPFLKANVAGN